MHYFRFAVRASATQTKLACIFALMSHEASPCSSPYPLLEGQVLLLILVLKGQVLVVWGSVLVNITGH